MADLTPYPQSPLNQRQARNYLLQPQVQVRLGLYNVLLSAVFGLAVFWLLRGHEERVRGMMELLVAEIPPPVQEHFQASLRSFGVWLALVVLVFVAASVLISIVFTHRLVGPTYAFRRQLAELTAGNYAARVHLRKDDAFVEVADDLNRLAAALQAAQRAGAQGGAPGDGDAGGEAADAPSAAPPAVS